MHYNNEIGITELGDNKVMKQSIDDAFITVFLYVIQFYLGFNEQRSQAQFPLR